MVPNLGFSKNEKFFQAKILRHRSSSKCLEIIAFEKIELADCDYNRDLQKWELEGLKL